MNGLDRLVEEHYRSLAEHYDELLRWSRDFVPTHARRMADHLDLGEDDLLVDLGCGPGIYSRAILELFPLRRPIVGVDLFANLRDRLSDGGILLLVHVNPHLVAYEHRVPTERYIEMVEHRYMSVLTRFSDDELRAGIAQMRARYGGQEVLEFTESFDYLIARPGRAVAE